MTAPASGVERRIALISVGAHEYVAVELDGNDEEQDRTSLRTDDLPDWVRTAEASDAPRWIMRTAAETYALLLGAGVRITRSHDLVLCHAILRDTSSVPTPLPASQEWERRNRPWRHRPSSMCSMRWAVRMRSPRLWISIGRSAA